jgi:glutamate dehydrogenase
VPEDAYLSAELARYFPTPIQRRFPGPLKRHRLRREIIATAITNSLINRMGPAFPVYAEEDTGADPAAIARAYTIAREVFAVRGLWSQIEALDNKIPASVQYAAIVETTHLLRHMSYWLLTYHRGDLDIERAVRHFGPGVADLMQGLGGVLDAAERARFEARRSQLLAQLVPDRLAARIAALDALHGALDLVEVSTSARVGMELAANAYFDLGERLGLSWIKRQIDFLAADAHWHAVARRTLRDNVYALQSKITSAALKCAGRDSGERVDRWIGGHVAAVDYLKRVLIDMRTGSAPDFATLSVALQLIRRLAEES